MGRYKDFDKKQEEYKKVFIQFLCKEELFFKFFEKQKSNIDSIIKNKLEKNPYTIEFAWMYFPMIDIFRSYTIQKKWRGYFNNYLQNKHKQHENN